MQEALSKGQPTPSASAGSGTWLCGLGPLNRSEPHPCWPLPPWAARVRTQVQRFRVHAVHDLFIFMDGDTESHLLDPTRPSFYPSVPTIHSAGMS